MTCLDSPRRTEETKDEYNYLPQAVDSTVGTHEYLAVQFQP